MYNRILLKLSGEALATADRSSVIDTEFTTNLAKQIKSVVDAGTSVAIVGGGGNIFRGAIGQGLGVDRVAGDYMGMLATVINGIAVGAALTNVGQPAVVMAPIAHSSSVLPYNQFEARKALDEGKVVIVAGGTGSPYFTTDTASSLRAVELKCNALLKGTKVDGVYSADPVTNPDAVKYETLTFDETLAQNLKVMDQTAFTMCRDNKIPIVVFNMFEEGNILSAAQGNNCGTVVG